MTRILAALTAIALTGVGVPAGAEQLPGSEWQPVEINGVPFEPVTEIFIRFGQDGQFVGNGGCNSMRGTFVTSQAAILMGPAAMTRMACPDDVNRQEFDFARTLGAARFFARNKTELTFSDGGGVPIMRLQQRDAD